MLEHINHFKKSINYKIDQTFKHSYSKCWVLAVFGKQKWASAYYDIPIFLWNFHFKSSKKYLTEFELCKNYFKKGKYNMKSVIFKLSVKYLLSCIGGNDDFWPFLGGNLVNEE